MARPVTLFTGQWADLPLEELCKKAKEFGYDGLELACWGDHFEVDKALSDDSYCQKKRLEYRRARSKNLMSREMFPPPHGALPPHSRVRGVGAGIRYRGAPSRYST